jgi:hypothetical protein
MPDAAPQRLQTPKVDDGPESLIVEANGSADARLS